MPLSILRLNQKQTHPNDRIVFIKPLDGPDKSTAQDYLNRLAAICVPIMKTHSLSVTTLEEFEPNREFWGRNFNAGECIQLVLKSPSTGSWLPMRFVQGVLMHELAHNEHMNHSRAFWRTNARNKDALRELWARSYTGEGIWGRGRALDTGAFADTAARVADADMPRALCGGVYRRRGAKRARKPQASYQEQKERRIAKKFGPNGQALGDDEGQRRFLEKGRWNAGTRPRVAQSKRGRELRANALLDRLDRERAEKEGAPRDESETESEYDEPGDGESVQDASGQRMVRVCEDDEDAGRDGQREMDELRAFAAEDVGANSAHAPDDDDDAETEDLPSAAPSVSPAPTATEPTSAPATTTGPTLALRPRTCPICSLDNTPEALICAACAHVLDTDRMPRFWRCKNETCRAGGYTNPEDAGRCGLCGGTKAAMRV